MPQNFQVSWPVLISPVVHPSNDKASVFDRLPEGRVQGPYFRGVEISRKGFIGLMWDGRQLEFLLTHTFCQ